MRGSRAGRGGESAVRIAADRGIDVIGDLRGGCRAGLLTYLGDASYSIYLCHGPVLFGLMLVADGLAWIPADLLLIAFAAAAVVVGCRVYELFERPAHALLLRRPVLAPAV